MVMLDTMPYSGVNGSNFTGDYSVNSWKLDVSKCDYAKLMFRYTMNEEYKNATTESLYGNEAAKTIYHGRLPTAYRCSVCSAAKIYQAQKTKSAKCLMRL